MASGSAELTPTYTSRWIEAIQKVKLEEKGKCWLCRRGSLKEYFWHVAACG